MDNNRKYRSQYPEKNQGITREESRHHVVYRERNFNDTRCQDFRDTNTQNDSSHSHMRQHRNQDRGGSSDMDRRKYSDRRSPFEEESPPSFSHAPIDLYPDYISNNRTENIPNNRNRIKSITGFNDNTQSRRDVAFNGNNSGQYYFDPFKGYPDHYYAPSQSMENYDGFYLQNSTQNPEPARISQPSASTYLIPGESTYQSQINPNINISTHPENNTLVGAFRDVSSEPYPSTQDGNTIDPIQNLPFSSYTHDTSRKMKIYESIGYNVDISGSEYASLEGEDNKNLFNSPMTITTNRKRKREDDPDNESPETEYLKKPCLHESEDETSPRENNFELKLEELKEQIKKRKAKKNLSKNNIADFGGGNSDSLNCSISLKELNGKQKSPLLLSNCRSILTSTKSAIRKLKFVPVGLPSHPSELTAVGWLDNGSVNRKELVEYYTKLDHLVDFDAIEDEKYNQERKPIYTGNEMNKNEALLLTSNNSSAKNPNNFKNAVNLKSGDETTRLRSTKHEKNRNKNGNNKRLSDSIENEDFRISEVKSPALIDLLDEEIPHHKINIESGGNIVIENRKKVIDSSSFSTEGKDFIKEDNLRSTQVGPSPRINPSLYNTNCRYDVFCTRNDCKFRHPPWAKRNTLGANNSINSKIKSTQNIRVSLTTWNTLATPLATSMKKNGKYDEFALDEEPRIALLLSELKKKMCPQKSFKRGKARNNILCLQEITQDLARGKLNKLCVENKYMSFFSPYGTISNGFMGNMILVPAESYTIIHSIDFIVSEYTELPVAKGYPNTMQVAILSEKKTSKTFMVANYHMPCQWQNPVVMTEHVKACVYLFEHYNLPILFAGDFNFTPKDTYYSLVCRDFKGIWNNNFVENSSEKLSPSQSTCRSQKIDESEICDRQIQNTTYSFIKAEFRGCIDHIFYSKDKIKLLSMDPIEELYNIIPDRFHPSDHLPVSAAFSIGTI